MLDTHRLVIDHKHFRNNAIEETYERTTTIKATYDIEILQRKAKSCYWINIHRLLRTSDQNREKHEPEQDEYYY